MNCYLHLRPLTALRSLDSNHLDTDPVLGTVLAGWQAGSAPRLVALAEGLSSMVSAMTQLTNLNIWCDTCLKFWTETRSDSDPCFVRCYCFAYRDSCE